MLLLVSRLKKSLKVLLKIAYSFITFWEIPTYTVIRTYTLIRSQDYIPPVIWTPRLFGTIEYSFFFFESGNVPTLYRFFPFISSSFFNQPPPLPSKVLYGQPITKCFDQTLILGQNWTRKIFLQVQKNFNDQNLSYGEVCLSKMVENQNYKWAWSKMFTKLDNIIK